MVGDMRHTSDGATLRELRRVRRDIRLGETEWFDVAYRVYLFALVGTIAVVLASDSISGLVDDSVTDQLLLTRGPSIAGVVAAIATAIGLRNGADGGPVSIESADIRHLLLSPIDQRRVMARPIAQRLRSVAFALMLGMGVLGQLVAREIGGSRAAWAASGALFGAVVGVLYVGTAVVSHAVRMPRWAASVVGGIGVAWQCAAAWNTWQGDTAAWARIGPANLDGSLLFWGLRQRGIDVIAIAIAVAIIVAALLMGRRLRLEPLERRGQLVSQLRFAATVQDVRTVVLLRRQLRAESMRPRPWFARRAHRPERPGNERPTSPAARPVRSSTALRPTNVWRRGGAALRRLPLGRLGRLAGLAAVGGASASLAVTESPLLLIVLVTAAFFVGLEAIEPLSQEVDHPDLTDAYPVDRGWIFLHHLLAPAGLLAVIGLIAAGTATIMQPSHAPAAFALAIPLAWAGAIGAVVTTVRDAAQPASIAYTSVLGADRGSESPFALPEFAGFSNVVSGAMPIVFSGVAAVPVYALSEQPSASTVLRSILGVALCLAMLCWWIVRRDRWAVRVREFFAAGRTDRHLAEGTAA